MMQKEKIKIYLNQNSSIDDLCLELLEKLEQLEIEKEGQALEIIAPANLFLTTNMSLKTQVSQKLIKLRVKFILRVDEK
ncbi:hypothetical protein GSQ54_20075 [Clostridioides difficile]|nr:hypothetical protein [Clostridioides difficile]